MKRRTFVAAGLATLSTAPLLAAFKEQQWAKAVDVLEQAAASGQVESASLHVQHGGVKFSRHFGKAASVEAMFLLGSISKPINVAALMSLYDEGKFGLDDRVSKYLPTFKGDGQSDVTIRHLLTHVSGLPDQLPENGDLRKRNAPLSEFVAQTLQTPLSFRPGTQYQYSSMGILLATHIGELVSGMDIANLTDKRVFQKLGMQHSAQGLGRFQLTDMVRCQMEGAAPESGSGDPTAKNWDWNSLYWRKLGAPWGTTHCSAPDIGLFLDEFLHNRGQVVKPETAKMMITNQNPAGLKSRGLGFDVGAETGGPGCSVQTFGHGGSTGTLCWADPATNTICVVLTSLPRRAVNPHPRELASNAVATVIHPEAVQ
ncbi:MAG: beta-lactamase family protein [Planctomycetaceae bacterium]|nr:beta-lactamase family protein [Planctomycetaceae bacterium]MCB9952794.1 beta-lactamase family protein [Planctomycetaceae bacterium]